MIPTICPYCSTNFRLPDSQAGLKVRCKVCDATIAVPEPEDDVPVLEEADPAPRGKSRGREAPDDRISREEPSRDRDRDRPAPSRSRSREDDDDDRPIRRRSRDDDDDEAPRGGMALFIILAIVGVTVVLVGGGVALTFALSGGSKPTPPAGGGPGPAPMPAPPVNPPGPGPAPMPVQPPPDQPKTPQTIDEALAALRVDSTRREALAFFRKTKPDARQDEVARALVALLGDAGVGREVAEALNEWATPAILDDVGRIAADSSPITSRRAMTVLAKLANDERAVPVLGRLFVAPHKAREVAPLLAKAGKKAESVVLPHLNHKERDVQREAEGLLLGYGTPEAKLREQTAKDLGSDDKDVQRNALRRLAKYRPDPDAMDEQARVARALEPMIKDFFLRSDAYAALEVWATKDSVPALIAALDDAIAPQGMVARVLVRLKDESSFEPLAAHYVKRGNLPELVKTLVAFGPPAEATALKLLNERSEQVRRAGLSILEEVGGKNALSVLSNPKTAAALRKADPASGPLITSAVAKIKSRMK